MMYVYLESQMSFVNQDSNSLVYNFLALQLEHIESYLTYLLYEF